MARILTDNVGRLITIETGEASQARLRAMGRQVVRVATDGDWDAAEDLARELRRAERGE